MREATKGRERGKTLRKMLVERVREENEGGKTLGMRNITKGKHRGEVLRRDTEVGTE